MAHNEMITHILPGQRRVANIAIPRSYRDSSGGPTAASRDSPGRPVPLVMFATVEKTLQAAPARVARDRVR